MRVVCPVCGNKNVRVDKTGKLMQHMPYQKSGYMSISFCSAKGTKVQ